jgi:hypothetical protein
MFGLVAPVDAALGQEPVNAFESATSPSPGRVILKEQFRFERLELETGPRRRRGEISDYTLATTVNIGLLRDTSLSLRFPAVYRDRERGDGGTDRDVGVGDGTVLVKQRIWRHDGGALDTQRLSVFGGAAVRTGDGPFTDDAYNPLAGLAYTQIAGRHGFNASLAWLFTTGGADEPITAGSSTADLLRYDGAYLYRLAPEMFEVETPGAWYAVFEVNGLYETNGDNELFLAPGLMYEARTWTAELSLRVPAWQRVGERAETEWAIIAGLRFSF